MKYCLTLPNAKCPSKNHPTDACWDLYTPVSFTLKVGKIEVINTGFRCQLPDNHDALIKERSKLAKLGVQILGGIVDNGYIGDWGVVMYNCGTRDIVFNIGDAIAQFMFVFKDLPHEIFELVDSLDQTSRGISGIWDSTEEKNK